jgi:hypothetical protein
MLSTQTSAYGALTGIHEAARRWSTIVTHEWMKMTSSAIGVRQAMGYALGSR